jgi:hypothetical protein
MKYIVFHRPSAALPLVVIFNGPLEHREMARMLKGDNYTPTSAGFVNDRGDAYGESRSLGLEAKPDDGELIRLMSRATLGVPFRPAS